MTHREPPSTPGVNGQESLTAKLAKLDTTKLVGLVVVVTYGLGVATVSFYLEHNEIPDPDLSFFKAHYVYTGIGVLGFFVLAASLVHICIAVTDGWRDAWKTLLVLVGWGSFLILLPYGFVLHAESGLLDGRQILLSIKLGAISIAVVCLGIIAYKAHGPGTARRAAAFVLGLLTLVLILFYVSLYSRDIYPLLPDQFGGGKPKQARVLFSQAGAHEARQLGIRLKPGTLLSEPVTLMLVSDSFYVLRPHPEGHIVQIAKDNVNGLQEDSAPPYAVDVQTRNFGRAGLPQRGDRLVLTFSEEMDSNSLIPSWSGKAVPAFIVDEGETGSPDALHFLAADHTDLSHLGVVELRAGGYERIFGQKAHPITIELRGRSVIVTLLPGVKVGSHLKPVERPDVMAWTPSSKATDQVGNPSEIATVIEEGSEDPSRADIDF